MGKGSRLRTLSEPRLIGNVLCALELLSAVTARFLGELIKQEFPCVC